MALKKAKKVEIVSDLEKSLKTAESVVFVKFDKLTVADANSLRRSLQKENVGYSVAKKTLLKRALVSKSIAGEIPELAGQVAVAFGTDPIASARGVYEFAKTHKENISILGGVYEGKYVDAVMMTSMATIPSREVLLSQIAFLLKSPMQRLAIAVNAVALKKA